MATQSPEEIYESLIDRLTSHIPDGWRLTHMTLLDPEWQCNITDGEHVAVGTGANIEEALASAGSKALNGETVGRLFSLGRVSAFTDTETVVDLRSLLGLNRPKVTINRRI